MTKEFCDNTDSTDDNYDDGADDDMMMMMINCVHLNTGSPTKTNTDGND